MWNDSNIKLRMNICDFSDPEKNKKRIGFGIHLTKTTSYLVSRETTPNCTIQQKKPKTMAMQVDLELKKVSCTALVCKIRSNFNV